MPHYLHIIYITQARDKGKQTKAHLSSQYTTKSKT